MEVVEVAFSKAVPVVDPAGVGEDADLAFGKAVFEAEAGVDAADVFTEGGDSGTAEGVGCERGVFARETQEEAGGVLFDGFVLQSEGPVLLSAFHVGIETKAEGLGEEVVEAEAASPGVFAEGAGVIGAVSDSVNAEEIELNFALTVER